MTGSTALFAPRHEAPIRSSSPRRNFSRSSASVSMGKVMGVVSVSGRFARTICSATENFPRGE